MKTAAQVMEAPRTVSPNLAVKELAKLLVKERRNGVCVVDEEGDLIGVVTSMDLIYQEKRPHLPTFFVLFDSVLPLDDPRKTEEELHKIAGAEVGDVMTDSPVTVEPDTPVDRIASLMVDRHITVLPVTDNGKLVGMVTKPGILRVVFGE